jgi:riboflavin transporter FmnP
MGIQRQFVIKNARKTMFSALFIILLNYFRTSPLFPWSLFMKKSTIYKMAIPEIKIFLGLALKFEVKGHEVSRTDLDL